MTVAVVNEPFSIRYQTFDSRDDVFPTAEIIDVNAVSLGTFNLPLIGDGLYGTSYTFTVTGSYTIRYRSYTTNTHTTEAGYGVQLEAIEASTAFNQAELEAFILATLQNLTQNNGNSASCSTDTTPCGNNSSLSTDIETSDLNIGISSTDLDC